MSFHFAAENMNFKMSPHSTLSLCQQKFQEEDLTKRSASQLAHLKPVAREYRGNLNLIPLAPKGDSCTSNWLEQWKNNGGQDYALLDLRTKEGRRGVAKFHHYEPAWLLKENEYDADERVSTKIYDCLFMLADMRVRDPVYFGTTEGLHRGIAVTHAITESKIDAFTAQLKPGSLTYESFVENGLRPQTIPSAGAVPTAVAAALNADDRNIMLDAPFTTLVTYITNPNADAEEVLNACRRKSQGISDSKLNSAKPNPTYLIGVYGENYMKSMTLENLTCHLDTSDSAAPITTRVTAAAAVKNLEKNPSTVLPTFPLLDHPDVQAYAKNPLDPEKRTRAEIALQCNAVSTATSQDVPPLRPPFYVDYSRMANESGSLANKTYCVTGEMRNEIILLPIFLLHLYAGSKNLTPREAVGKAELVNLTDYALRYHCGAETGQANLHNLHGNLTAIYGLNYGHGCLSTEFGGLLGAAVLIVNMWNSCLAMASYEPDLSPDARIEKVKEAAELFGGAFVTLDSVAGDPPIDSTISHLGELQQIKINFCNSQKFIPQSRLIIAIPKNYYLNECKHFLSKQRKQGLLWLICQDASKQILH